MVNSLNTINEGFPETELPLWIVGKPYSAIYAIRLIVLVLTLIDLKLKLIIGLEILTEIIEKGPNFM